ncbi:MAG: PEGA domain-containing protein, partial [Bdellovibrionales bacterium]|nr:PEGA domain-containing protein [Bdellovibrionales bacterium]
LKRLGLVLSLIAFLLYFFDLIPAIWIYKVSKPLGLYRQPASFSDAIPEFDIRKSNKNEGVLFLIDSDPREAQIIVDGKRIYRRTPLRLRTEPGKKMLIRLEKRGYAFVEKPVNTLSESFKPNLIPTFKVEDSDR